MREGRRTGGRKGVGAPASPEAAGSAHLPAVNHAGLRVYGDHDIPAYAFRERWHPVRGLNTYAGEKPLPDRCSKQPLARSDMRHRSPTGAPTGECFQLDLRRPDQTQPVLPTLFVPGFPKCATTWLYECMHDAYVPETVCDGASMPGTRRRWRGGVDFDPQQWNRTNCRGRRFMLPGTACYVVGGCGHRKELFFYGSGFGDMFKAGMAMLHGPELPLEMFQKFERPPAGWSRDDFERYRVKRHESFCYKSEFTHLPDGRMHPTCCVADARVPKAYGCRWHETLRIRHGRSRSTWFQNAMPWVKPGAYEFATPDFTPNYLCSHKALYNIRSTAANPDELRFIVLMRDPIMRAYSEWSMFCLHWHWDHDPSLRHRFRAQMANFKQCNATLAANPELLHSLPDDELFHYIKRCFRSMAMDCERTRGRRAAEGRATAVRPSCNRHVAAVQPPCARRVTAVCPPCDCRVPAV